MKKPKVFEDDVLMDVIDAVDKRGGQRLLDAKHASIVGLRKDGYTDAQIEELLNVKLP